MNTKNLLAPTVKKTVFLSKFVTIGSSGKCVATLWFAPNF